MNNQIIKKFFQILLKKNLLDILLGGLIYGNYASSSKNLEAKILQNKKYQYKIELNLQKVAIEIYLFIIVNRLKSLLVINGKLN